MSASPSPAHRSRRTRASRLIPGPQAPTRHPRRDGLGTVRVGDRLTVRFSGVDPDGAATVRLGAVRLSVPFGVPGEEAVVEVTKGGRRADGRLVALLRKSPDVHPARCVHFGRCGGCQWQHLALEAQRRLKTRLVKDYLKEHANLRRDLVADTLGGEAWAYRNVMRVVFAERGGEVVLGYHGSGSSRVLDIVQCPVQHPLNEVALRVAKEAVCGLRLSIYDRARATGLVRGIVGIVSFTTGEGLLTLSTTAPLPDPTGAVRAFIDRVPGLVGILNCVQPGPSPDLLGPRLRLLWGRDHLEEQIRGFRVRVRPTTEMPANPRAMDLLIEAIVRAAEVRAGDVALDLAAQTPVVALALAQTCEGVTGVVSGRRAAADAWDAARANGVPNALFTVRDPPDVLAAIAARRQPDVVVVTAEGPGVAGPMIGAVAAAGVPRVVYVARALGTCARDLVAWRRAGYEAVLIQPVDLLPQTSHVHIVAALRRAG
ncbi:MAG: 23S rRNA (uracil(1939)-C(5))-methyltransferase RlmD [Armatimonadota bacterium]|nr:23S rRNA (uracil(1939)-C(5))-methyltransferase RlmD [Armatimonadota bacterium]